FCCINPARKIDVSESIRLRLEAAPIFAGPTEHELETNSPPGLKQPGRIDHGAEIVGPAERSHEPADRFPWIDAQLAQGAGCRPNLGLRAGGAAIAQWKDGIGGAAIAPGSAQRPLQVTLGDTDYRRGLC